MIDPVTIVLLGEPVAWARARPGRQASGSGGFLITPQKQRNNAATLRLAASQEMLGREPFDCPVIVDLVAVMSIPKSMSKRDREAAILGRKRPDKVPDLTNIAKQVEDAFNKVVWTDDRLVVEYGTLRKVYGTQPKLVVTVRPLAAADLLASAAA